MNKIPDELKSILKSLLNDENFRRFTIEEYGVCPKDENDVEGFEKLFATPKFKREKLEALFLRPDKRAKKLDKMLDELFNTIRMKHSINDGFSEACQKVSKAMGDDEPRMIIKVYSNRAKLEAKQPQTNLKEVDIAVMGASALKAIKAALSSIQDEDVRKFTLEEAMKEMNIELD